MDRKFENWWKNYGQYTQEVVEKPKLEESFKVFGYRVYKEFEKINSKCDNCGHEN